MESNIPKFTFCITSKNNLRYLKHAIFYIKQNSIIDHNILVFIDSDNDGTETWCIENNVKYLKMYNVLNNLEKKQCVKEIIRLLRFVYKIKNHLRNYHFCKEKKYC